MLHLIAIKDYYWLINSKTSCLKRAVENISTKSNKKTFFTMQFSTVFNVVFFTKI